MSSSIFALPRLLPLAWKLTPTLAQLPPPFHRTHCYIMLFAILLPGISMIFRGHILKGLLCGILHVTVIGWIPAAIWAVASYREDLAEKRHQETLEVLARQGRTY
jgi:type IV secretory pathway TrbD component